MTSCEALSNLVFAPISALKDVKASCNWMWPAKVTESVEVGGGASSRGDCADDEVRMNAINLFSTALHKCQPQIVRSNEHYFSLFCYQSSQPGHTYYDYRHL